MKPFTLLNYLLLLGLITFFSCAENDDDTIIDENKFSQLSIEEGKQKIENAGQEMLDEMKLMEKSNAMEVYSAFVSFIETSDPLEDGNYYEKSASTKDIYGIETIKSLTSTEINGMGGILKSMLSNGEDPETLQEVYDLMIGVYTWNDTYQKWNYSETGNKIVFNFPSTEEGTQNNATYTINYEGININNNRFEDEYSGDFPKNVTAELKLNGSVISHSVSEFSYDSEGSLTAFEFSYYIDEYLLSASFSNNKNDDAEVNFIFKSDEKTFMDLKLFAYGDWSDENVDNNTTYYVEYFDYDEWEWVEIEVDSDDDYDYSELDFYNVVTRSNAIFQVMDIKITGDIDIQNLVPEIEEIEENWDWDNKEEEAYNEEIELINEYVNLALRDAANNEILALCEAYVIKDEHTYYFEGEYVTGYDFDLGLRFVFADGSKIDAETYFDEDFDDLIDELEDYIDELEEKYDD